MDKPYKYKAFISYAHKDKAFAQWLQRGIENYKIPKSLRAKYPNLPKNLKRSIFRDEEELAAASDLSETLKIALENSEKLIVVCSQNAVDSKWVEQEIVYFKKIHSEEKIFNIIKSGEPNEVLPKLLDSEPLAIDARKHRKMALIKIIASLLEIDFADLWKREVRESFRRTVLASVGVILFIIMGAYLYLQSNAITSNSELERINEKILELKHELKEETLAHDKAYVLGEKLEDLEKSKRVKEETLKWFGLLKTSVSNKAKEVYDKEGAVKALMVLESLNSLEEDRMYARKNMLRAKLYIEIGEFEKADEFYDKAVKVDNRYINVYDYALFLMKQNQIVKTKKLLESLDMKHLDKAEQANVLNRLGIVYRKLKRLKEAKVVYEKALMLREELSIENPKKYKRDLAWTHNNLGVLYGYSKEFESAEKEHLKALALRQELMRDNALKGDYYVSCSLHNLGELYHNAGKNRASESYLLAVLKLRTKLYKKNPKELTHPLAWSKHELASLYVSEHRFKEAEVLYKEALALRETLVKSNFDAYKCIFNDSVKALVKLYRETGREKEAKKLDLEMKPIKKGECDAT